MLKFIIPAIIVFLIVLFWEKISDYIYKKTNIKINYIILIILFWEKITNFVEKKFNIKLNYIVVSSIIVAIAIILLLLNY